MISELPISLLPDWLAQLSPNQVQAERIPIRDVLHDSLFYPSARFDGDPVKYLAGNVFSFVYVDYGVDRVSFSSELRAHGFSGYHVIASRDIAERELTPDGWTPQIPRPEDGDPRRAMINRQPFAVWSVLQRDPHKQESHGPLRFSLLYICGDGAATFQALYATHRASPKVIAIIQPGHAFGGNWTDFTNPSTILGRSVLTNPAGIPDYMLYGGYGGKEGYDKPCWPQFSQFVKWMAKDGGGTLGLWKQGA